MTRPFFRFHARLSFRQWAELVDAGQMPVLRRWLDDARLKVAQELER